MTERELERRAQRKLAVLCHVEEVSGNVAATCRYYGISRQCYYMWRRRYEADGVKGLKDRSSRPTLHRRRPRPRWSRGSCGCGSTTTSGRPRSPRTWSATTTSPSAPPGVWRILKRLGLNRLPASQRYQRHDRPWKRYEKQRPGHQLQVDVKFIEPLAQTGRRRKCYQFTAIDDCTRLRVLRA